MRLPNFTVQVDEHSGTVTLTGDSDISTEVCEIILDSWLGNYGNFIIGSVINDELIHHIQVSLHNYITKLVYSGTLLYFSNVQKWCWNDDVDPSNNCNDFYGGFPAIPERKDK